MKRRDRVCSQLLVGDSVSTLHTVAFLTRAYSGVPMVPNIDLDHECEAVVDSLPLGSDHNGRGGGKW